MKRWICGFLAAAMLLTMMPVAFAEETPVSSAMPTVESEAPAETLSPAASTEPTPAETPTQEPAATEEPAASAVPTETPNAEETALPTSTPEATATPAATATAEVTATPTATATAEATATPTATATAKPSATPVASDGQMNTVHRDLSNITIQFGGLDTVTTAEGTTNVPAAIDNRLPQYRANTIETVIYNGLKNWSTSIDVSSFGVSYDDAFYAFSRVINANPELFYVGYYVSANGTETIAYTIMPEYSQEYTPADCKKYEQAVSNALKCVNGSMSDLEKALALHDFLSAYCVYDYGYNNYNAYNALVEGLAVCQGYTLAYEDLLKRCGITNATIPSDAMDHIWNALYLNGSWYHVDVTWDSTSDYDRTYHSYFLLSDTAMRKSHSTWNPTSIVCSNTAYDSAFWQRISYNIAAMNGTYYYIASAGSGKYALMKKNGYQGAASTIYTYPATSLGSAIVADNSIYFNSNTAIYNYNGVALKTCQRSDGAAFLNGLAFRDGNLVSVLDSYFLPVKTYALTDVVQASNGAWYYISNAAIQYGYTGVKKNSAGWWYINKGKVDTSYNGVASNENGTWVIAGGRVNFNANGVVAAGNAWYYAINGLVQTNYTGVRQNSAGWWYINKGKVDVSYNGVASNESGTWIIAKGKVNGAASGVVAAGNAWYYAKNGLVQTNYTGVRQNSAGWWYINKGKVDVSYNGVASNESGTWIIAKGKVNGAASGVVAAGNAWYYAINGLVQTKYTGVQQNSYGWWYINKGKVDTSYTGVASNQYGMWYIKNGKLDTSANGIVDGGDGNSYRVKNGKVTGKV